ncbi:MAG: SH3 domain-containing protein [Clostridia bacterium]|nr:SH3 domain-containing protein [Clostridia bacterium]
MRKLIFLLMLILLFFTTAYAESMTGVTKTGNLNVRKKAASTSDRVAIIRNKGEVVTILKEEENRMGNRWYYIEMKNGKKGYVQAEYIDASTDGDAVDASQASHTISFRTSHTGGETYNSVGDVWTFYHEINGKQIDRKNGVFEFIAGEEYTFYTRVREQDSIPDTGATSLLVVPTNQDIMNGFSVELKVKVEENSGPYRGKSVVWTVLWTIDPILIQ